MKTKLKPFFILMILISLVAICSCNKDTASLGNASGTSSGAKTIGEEYLEISSDGVLKVKPEYRGKLKGNVAIPSQVNGVAVVAIAAEGLHQQNNMESVVIPEGVVEIGNNAFSYCEKLKTVSLPASLKSIGDYAFWGDALSEIVVPESVQSIGVGAFKDCAALKSAVLPASLTEIPNNLFCGDGALEEITIPKSVTKINHRAFMNTGLVAVEIPESVEVIDTEAFKGCYKLTSVLLHDGIKEIHSEAFSGCVSLKDIEFPDSIVVIGEEAFFRCAITRLRIPRGIVNVDRKKNRNAFAGCNHLETLKLHNDIKAFGFMVLDSNSSIKEIVFDGTIAEFRKRDISVWPSAFPIDCVLKCTDGYVTVETRMAGGMSNNFIYDEIEHYY